MTAVMVLGAEVLPHNRFNVLNLINLRLVVGLVVVVPDLRSSQRVEVDQPLHFFFLDAGPLVACSAIFLPTLEKVIDCGTG